MAPPLKIALFERLSSLVRPVNYKLLLKPNLDTGLFQGNVRINIVLKQEKNYVNLHTKFLDISKVQVFKGDREIPVYKYLEVEKLEQLLIEFSDPLSPGSYDIDIDFQGNLIKKFVGFYSSHLRNNKTMVASKFQPTYARQAFPCFDEPDFKATYDITLVRPKNYIALSNMNEISSSPDNETDSEVVKFATSVPMSTYLACFVICDFGSKQTEINSKGIGNNFILSSFAQKDQMHKIDFAQDIGKRATEFYIQYYEVPFPLPKLDMIAIPDYESSAAEHWGLITYRETSFLVDESTASAQNKISVANTIAHELAHMWFGNLVTLKRWDDLWLNEGFASYMQVKSLNAIEPSWTMLDQFLVRTMHSVLVTDAKLSSHPIVQTVDTPDQITAMFDAISYSKGASVLRMLEGFVGEENFRKGVSDYLKKYEFGNTVTQDLLGSLVPYFKKDNPDLSLAYILDTWTRQMGYPLLTVTKSSSGTYRITQKRFLLDPKAVSPKDSDFNYRWFVPITYKTDKGVHEKIIWFGDEMESVEITEKDASWLKINNNQVGYYRVNYPEDMWQSLIEQLKRKSNQLTISDRSHLLDEVFALAEAGAVPYELALNLTTYLTEEEELVPWQTASGILGALGERLLNTLAHDDLKAYMQELVTPIFKRINQRSNPSGVIERLLRTTILSLAVESEHPEAQQMLRRFFLDWLESHGSGLEKTVETDLRALVYYHGMKSASQSEWDKLWQIYKKTEDVHEQLKLELALAAPRDTSILKKYLILAWDESNVRAYLLAVHMVSDNPSGTALVWDDVRGRWPELVERYTQNSRYLGNTIPGNTDSFNTELKRQEVMQSLRCLDSFFSQHQSAGAGAVARERAYGKKSPLETERNNIAWSARAAPGVAAWLAARQASRQHDTS